MSAVERVSKAASLIAAAGFLIGCAATPRDLTPREEIWRQAYCGYHIMAQGDYERVARWGDEHVKDCRPEGVRDVH